MEKRKIRVAIVHSGKNSSDYALIEKTFVEQTLTELFEPVRYEAAEDNGIEQVVAAYKEGDIDAVVDVTGNGSDNRSQEAKDRQWEKALGEEGKGMAMLLTENMRIALKKTDATVTAELIVQMAEEVHKSLRRDFRISSPRIAVLYQTSKNDKRDESVAATAIKQLTEQSIQAYGPYNAGDFFENGRHLEFDAVIGTDAEQGIMHFKNIANDDAVRYTAGLTLVRTKPALLYGLDNIAKLEAGINELRQAIYKAIDIVRHRKEYDIPLANPLKKLYKDRKDESEKIRFNIPKKKEQPEK